MRSYIHTCSALAFLGLVTTPSWAQLRLPDTGTSFLEDTKESAPENADKKKKRKDDGKDAEVGAKATDPSSTTSKPTGSADRASVSLSPDNREQLKSAGEGAVDAAATKAASAAGKAVSRTILVNGEVIGAEAVTGAMEAAGAGVAVLLHSTPTGSPEVDEPQNPNFKYRDQRQPKEQQGLSKDASEQLKSAGEGVLDAAATKAASAAGKAVSHTILVNGEVVGAEAVTGAIEAAGAGGAVLLHSTPTGSPEVDEPQNPNFKYRDQRQPVPNRTSGASEPGDTSPQAAATKTFLDDTKVGQQVPGFGGLNRGPDKRITSATTASATSSGPSFDLKASARKAGINVDAPAPQKIVVNTAAVTKLLGLGAIPTKAPSHNPAELQARLDNHVDDWKRQEDQRIADEKAERAAEARELAEERREIAARNAELEAWGDAYVAARHDRVVARREAREQAYRDQQRAIYNANQQRAAMAAAQMASAAAQMQALQNAQQANYSPYSGGSSSVPDSGTTWYGGSTKSECAIDGGMGVRRCSADELKNRDTEAHTDTANPSTATTSDSSTTSTSPATSPSP